VPGQISHAHRIGDVIVDKALDRADQLVAPGRAAFSAYLAQVGGHRRGREEQAQLFHQGAVGQQMKTRPAVEHQFRRPPEGHADQVIGI
jgi:hypothetical protein